MTQITIFDNLFDNKTDKQMMFSDFNQFENLLYKLSEIPRKSKRDSHLISPACYKEGTNRRCNENVSHWSTWAAMDVDDHDFTPEDFKNELIDSYGHYRFICYSTASSRNVLPKFRLVFSLSEIVQSNQIRHFWYALNKELNGIGDPQTKDLSRMFYIPGYYASADNFIFSSNSSCDINPKDLINKYPYIETKSSSKHFLDRLPQAMQKAVIEHRKNSMARSNEIRWTGYRDCPFVNQNLIKEYKSIAHIDNSGRYAMIYRIMSSIATSAIKQGYPITSDEIVSLIRELDMETSRRYTKRPLNVEADRALEFAYRKL